MDVQQIQTNDSLVRIADGAMDQVNVLLPRLFAINSCLPPDTFPNGGFNEAARKWRRTLFGMTERLLLEQTVGYDA